MQTNDRTNWERRLAGATDVPTHDGFPDYGFYRVRSRDKQTWRTIAYWYDPNDGTLRCRLAGRDLEEQQAQELWTYACRNPITHELYMSIIAGGQWPDVNEAVAGHNRAPVEDDLTAIQDRIEDLAREAEKMIAGGGAPSQAIADQASDLANTFGELESKVTRLHKDEKEPHLEAGRTVDRKWFPIRDRAAELKRRLKLIVLTPFLTKKREEQEKAQVAAIQSGAPAETVAPVRAVAGSSKRSSGLRTHYRAEIEDRSKLLDALKDHPDVIACIQRIADAAAGKKLAMPGCKIVSEQRAA